MDVLEAASELEAKGHSVISFSLGEPDFSAPRVVEEACIKAIRKHHTKYTHSKGLPALREAIAGHYFENYSVKIDPDQILVTQGTSPAFFLIFSTLLENNSEVILPNPHYPCDANFVEFVGGKNVFLPLFEEEGYQWDLNRLRRKISRQTRAIFVTSPSNPTGTVLEKQILKGIADTKIPIVSDEIYHGLVYCGRAHSLLEFSDHVFVVNGFSKAYSMTGFRLGYVIAPKKYIRPLQKIQQNFYISANSFVQEAGIAALKKAKNHLNAMKLEYDKRRHAMIKGLMDLGFAIPCPPQGAFYVFVNCKHLSSNSYTLAFDILNKAHVAVTPGIDFGSRGEGYLRFSYALGLPEIEEGLRRLRRYLKTCPKKSK